MNFYQFNKKPFDYAFNRPKYQHLVGAFFSDVRSLRMNFRVQVPISEGSNTPVRGTLLHI